MTEEKDKLPAKKKHKIIDWSPRAKEKDKSEEPAKKRKVNVWTLAAVILIGVFLGTWFLWQWNSSRGTEERSGALGKQSSNAEAARVEALDLLSEARKKVDEHPLLLEKLVESEKAFEQGERSLAVKDYTDAIKEFKLVEERIANFDELYSDKLKAENAREAVQSLIQRYQAQRALAPQAYQTALNMAENGDELLKKGSFAQANEQFERGMRALDPIKEKIAEANEDNINRGNKALATGDKDSALEAFRAVLELDPENKEIQRKLKRAETIDQVYPLLETARGLEEQGDLEVATETYEKALAIDPLSVRAQQGKSRVEGAIKQSAFKSALAAARTAEAGGDWKEAVLQYKKALEIYPNRPEIQQALNNAIKMEEKFRLETELRKAYALENERQWNQAREVYLKILELDKDNPDAEEGLLRSGKMVRILLRYEKLIEIAKNYAEQGEFQSAIKNFNEAMNLKPEYLSLETEVLELKKELDLQSQPMPLTLKSNGRTWVSIVGFELLGKFRTKEINILPGVYQVQGTRRRYKNVDFEIRIQQGKDPGPITVICDERLE